MDVEVWLYNYIDNYSYFIEWIEFWINPDTSEELCWILKLLIKLKEKEKNSLEIMPRFTFQPFWTLKRFCIQKERMRNHILLFMRPLPWIAHGWFLLRKLPRKRRRKSILFNSFHMFLNVFFFAAYLSWEIDFKKKNFF